MKQPKFNNGDKVKDKVSGLTGIIVATTTWLNSCIRYVVQPQEIREGKPVEGTSLDENDLILIKSGVIKDESTRETGGPVRGDQAAKRRF